MLLLCSHCSPNWMFDCVQNKTKQAITLTATESQLHCHMVVNISELFGLVELIWSIELLSTRFFRKLCLVQHFTFCLFSFLYFNGLLSPFIKCIHLDVWVFWIRHSHSFTRYGIRNEWEKKSENNNSIVTWCSRTYVVLRQFHHT